MNTQNINFAYKVRHALTENLDHLPPSTTERLASARKLALSRKKAQPNARILQRWPYNARALFSSLFSFAWLGRLSVAVPLVALVVALGGVVRYEEQQRIADIAELDAAVLSDELPLTAYLDHGFNAYLAQSAQ